MTVSSLRSLWELLDRKQRRTVLWLQALCMLMAVATLAGVASLMPFLLALTNRESIATQPALAAMQRALAFGSPTQFTAVLGAGFVLAMLVANLVNLLGNAAMTRFALAVGDEFHVALLDEYLSRDHRDRTAAGAGTLSNRVVYTVNRVATGLIDGCLALLANAMSVLVICASMIWLNPGIVLTALAWVGSAYLVTYALVRRRLNRDGAAERELVEQRARMARESLKAARELQTSGGLSGFVQRFDRVCRALSRIWLVNHLLAQSPRHVLECATFAGLIGVVLVMNGDGHGALLPQLSFLALASYRLLPAVHQLFASVVRIRHAEPFFDEILPDLRAALPRRRAAPTGANPGFGNSPHGELRLEGVSVMFGGQPAPSIDEVSLSIPARSMIGLIGANGSGKTTLADVIAGLLPPDRGRLIVDGLEVGQHNRASWRRQVAYVTQEVFLLDASIAENIAFGVPSPDIDRERVAEAARLAGLGPRVSRMAQGLDAPVSEEGLRLSGGYRQRVAIARAFYRRAPLLILDEATSSMDQLSEQELVDVLAGMRGQCTLILIAHRQRMLRNCDWIYELEAGKVVAQGTFDELCAASPVGGREEKQLVER